MVPSSNGEAAQKITVPTVLSLASLLRVYATQVVDRQTVPVILTIPSRLDVSVESRDCHIRTRRPLQFTDIPAKNREGDEKPLSIDTLLHQLNTKQKSSENLFSPAQLCRDEVTMRTILRGILVHTAQ